VACGATACGYFKVYDPSKPFGPTKKKYRKEDFCGSSPRTVRLDETVKSKYEKHNTDIAIVSQYLSYAIPK